MTIYYKKINLPIDHSCIDDIEGLKDKLLIEYSKNLGYFTLKDVDIVKNTFFPFFKVHPKTIRLVQSKFYITPHVDNGFFCCLNYYIRPQNQTTRFWKPKENAVRVKGSKFNATTNSYEQIELAYARKDLDLVDSFNAEVNDIYFLNVGEVHSVGYPENKAMPSPRTFIQFHWDPDTRLEHLLDDLGF